MKQLMKARKDKERQRGASMLEYALLVAFLSFS